MTIEELHRALPNQLRVTPEMLPPAIAKAIDFLTARDAMRDAGAPESQIPAVAEWRAGHGG